MSLKTKFQYVYTIGSVIILTALVSGVLLSIKGMNMLTNTLDSNEKAIDLYIAVVMERNTLKLFFEDAQELSSDQVNEARNNTKSILKQMPADYSCMNEEQYITVQSIHNIYDIYDKNHVLVGAVGYSTYEPYEGDRDSVQIVYSALRLGSVYRFDTDNKYDVIQTTERGTTALTTVIFLDGANSEPVNNLGFLAYDNEKECFVAIELEASAVSESQALEIAKSIRF